jgi:hypothetical protein
MRYSHRAPLILGLLLLPSRAAAAAEEEESLQQQRLRFGLWQRGDHEPSDGTADLQVQWSMRRHEPILSLRGGVDGCSSSTASCDGGSAVDLEQLRLELGPEFAAAIDANIAAHEEDCAASCETFYCGDASASASSAPDHPSIRSVRSYSMGSVPPEDFAAAFRFPLDLIKVTDAPMIPPDEAEQVIATANEEGLRLNEYNSGKYKLGGDWVKKMPRTLEWFNRRLEATVFPTIAALFPEVVAGPHVLRAHSVAILKYNSSHPRTDVHVDDGILALTLALSPRANYTGGGTFFEHLGEENIIEMEQVGDDRLNDRLAHRDRTMPPPALAPPPHPAPWPWL